MPWPTPGEMCHSAGTSSAASPCAAIITACTGHTGPELRMGQTYTPAECERMLYADLAKHADDLDCIKMMMTDNQKAAFLSFAFNVGRANFCGSTLARKANAGDMRGACNELTRWVHAGASQTPLPGLVARRKAERELCLRGAA